MQNGEKATLKLQICQARDLVFSLGFWETSWEQDHLRTTHSAEKAMYLSVANVSRVFCSDLGPPDPEGNVSQRILAT